MPPKPRPIAERIAEKTNINPKTGCHEWGGSHSWDGYARLKVRGKMVYAHRVAYELKNGAVPTGLEIDHLCRNRGCINPDHLEAVTRRENTRRGKSESAVNMAKTHCKYGHEFTAENTYRYGNRRYCRTCSTEYRKSHLEQSAKYARDYRRRKADEAQST